MTKQEAKVLAARLTRIWKMEYTCEIFEANRSFTLRLHLNDEVLFSCVSVGGGLMYRVTDRASFLSCLPGGRIEEMYLERPTKLTLEEKVAAQAHFAAHWMSFFRRTCWLCGCPIEASAHEEMEWMRDFTKEESESWNLKI